MVLQSIRPLVVTVAVTALAASQAFAQNTTSYQYDPLGRAVSATYSNGTNTAYTYDSADNRTNLRTSVGATTPTAVNDTVVTSRGSAITFDPRTNDLSPLGYGLSVTSVSTASNGSTSSNGTTITYTPASGFMGWDSFTYTISDGHNNTSSATVLVSVAETPIAVNQTFYAPYNTAFYFDPRTGDSSPLGYPLSVASVAAPSHGTATSTSTSAIYTPTSGYSGLDNFNYTVVDSHGGTGTAIVTLHVNTASPPTAVNQNYSATTTDGSDAWDPRIGDSSPQHYSLVIQAVGQPQKGSVVINSGGTSITYSPPPLAGTDTFSYTISDGHNGWATATITVTIAKGACQYC